MLGKGKVPSIRGSSSNLAPGKKRERREPARRELPQERLLTFSARRHDAAIGAHREVVRQDQLVSRSVNSCHHNLVGPRV